MRRLSGFLAASMLLAPADETSGSGGAVPPPPPSVVKAIIDAAQKGSGDATRTALEAHGIQTVFADVKTWTPFKKEVAVKAIASDDLDALIAAASTLRIEVLPAVVNAKGYEDRDPVAGTKGIRLAQFVKAQLIASKTGRHIKEVVADLAARGKLDPFVVKALQEGTMLDGGALVPPQFSSELIPLLRAKTVLLKAGIQVVAMETDQLIYGRQNAPATAVYAGEAQVVAYSQAKVGQLKLSAKKLAAITAVTDEMLNDAGPVVDELIRQDLVQVIALRMEAAREEMRHCGEFDYVIMNQDFARAVDDLSAIVRAARLTSTRQQVRHSALINLLLHR